MALLAFALVSSPSWAALGASPDALVLLDSWDFTANAHAAWRIHATGGASYKFESTLVPQNTGAASLLVLILDGTSLAPLHGVLLGGGEGGGVRQIHVEAAPLGAVDLRHEGGLPGFGATLRGSFTQRAAHEQELVLLSVGGAVGVFSGSMNVSGDSGIAVVGRSTGSAFLRTEPDFRGPVNVVAKLPLGSDLGPFTPRLHFKLIRNASATEWVDGRLFGIFEGATYSGDLEMGYDGPAGSVNGLREYRFLGTERGRYDFRIDRNADTFDPTSCLAFLLFCPPPTVAAFGADVRIP